MVISIFEFCIFYNRLNIKKNSRFLPLSSNPDGKTPDMCDPWQAEKFNYEMNRVPDMTCDHCLPDCSSTTYTASVSGVPFRKCDDKNMGVSFLCDLTGADVVNPPIFGESLRKQYTQDALPEYIEKRETNWRHFSLDSYNIFKNEEEDVYNAYDRVRTALNCV